MVGELVLWKMGRKTGSRWSDRALHGISRRNLGYVVEGLATQRIDSDYLLVDQWSQSG